MAIEVFERSWSRPVKMGLTSQSATIELFIRGTSDDSLARAAVIASTPATFFGLLFDEISLKPLGGTCWEATIEYKSGITETVTPSGNEIPPSSEGSAPAETDALPAGFAFDIGNKTETLFTAENRLWEIREGNNAVVAPDGPFAKDLLIGVTDKGEVQGVETIVGTFEWSLTKMFPFVTLKYARMLHNTVGKINQDPFWGWERGEVKYLGGSCNVKGQNEVEITFRFETIPNEEDIVISEDPLITVPSKQGHEYLWIKYVEAMKDDRLTLVPFAAIVDQISKYADFKNFGIGA